MPKQARIDIHLAVLLLCTRAIDPGTYDYNNMARAMNYIQGIIVLLLILPIDNAGNIKWYVGAALALHKETRSHTDGFIIMVTGGYYVQCSKQKLNTKSSTDVELVKV